MAAHLEKSGSLVFEQSLESRSAEKPRTYEELGLCLALVVLVGWSLYAGLHTVDWSAVGHTFKVILSVIGIG